MSEWAIRIFLILLILGCLWLSFVGNQMGEKCLSKIDKNFEQYMFSNQIRTIAVLSSTILFCAYLIIEVINKRTNHD